MLASDPATREGAWREGSALCISSRSRRMFLREVCSLVRLPLKRGRRECRAPDAPASRVCNGSGRAHTRRQVTPVSPGIPRAMVYGLYRALPGDRLFCHRRRRNCFRRLDTSVGVSGPHVFAVRKLRPRLRRYLRPPHPAAHVRDDRETPLERWRDRIAIVLIWPRRQAEVRKIRNCRIAVDAG